MRTVFDTPESIAHSRNLVRTKNARSHPNRYPRDAACLIILDRSGRQPRILMGRRRPDLVFMPGKYVFPGGRVEAGDYLATAGAEMPEALVVRLLRGLPKHRKAHRQRALALAYAAMRETAEETGVVIEATVETGGRGLSRTRNFSAFSLLARAITPPGFPRRYDTRFFIVSAENIAGKTDICDGEFVSIEWLTLDEARRHDTAAITRIILGDLKNQMERREIGAHDTPKPFYFMKGACFHRIML